jgi:hypothetical protein
MPRNEQPLADLNTQIERFTTFKKEKLIQRTEWGSISLEEARTDFDRIYSIVEYLKVLPIELLTVNSVNAINAEIEAVNNLFDSINKFNIESGNPANQRNTFVSQIQAQADSLYTNASPWIPFLAYQKGDVSRNIENLTSSVSEAQTMVDDAKIDIEKKGTAITDIIAKAREASAAGGAAVFTKDFLEEAKTIKDSAQVWLKITSGLAIVTLIVAALLWFFTEAGLDQGQMWQKITTKVVVLGILVTSTVWCGRIYKALMHQSTVNRHRALSIQTLKAFSAAADDVQIKDAVVLEAARSVFGSVNTGYIDGRNESGESDVKIFEVAKSIIPNGKG